jgi:predicted nucleotide-binding protein
MVTGPQRVLVCDDDAKKYGKLKRYLESEGFVCDDRVETQGEVEQALRRAQEKREWYQIVMLDMDLSMGAEPGTNGAQLYFNLLHEFPNETYVIYSSQDADQFRVEINRLMYRDVKFVLLDGLLREKNIRLHLESLVSRTDPTRVFLVHGRNHKRKDGLVKLLTKGFGLEVVGWEDARERASSRRDYIFEIVMKGIEMSHVTVVLFTDDELVELKKSLQSPADKGSSQERRQARANVYIEAGYAMGVRPGRTIFVEWPMKGRFDFTSPSDFSGLHTIRFNGDKGSKAVLKRRLEAARCTLTAAADWETMSLA